MCGGLVVRVPASIVRPTEFESRPVASLQGGLRGGRSHCKTVLIMYETQGLGGL